MTAAALAVTMTLSLGMAPAADAASTRISNYGQKCTISGTGSLTDGTYTRAEARDLLNANPELDGKVVSSANLAEAYGSSDSVTIPGRETYKAFEACANGKAYQTQPMDDTTKGLIIAGSVIGGLVVILAAAAPFIEPVLKQFLP